MRAEMVGLPVLLFGGLILHFGVRVYDKVVELLPEIAGGFIAYCLHLVYHAIWHRPGHALVRRFSRKHTPPAE